MENNIDLSKAFKNINMLVSEKNKYGYELHMCYMRYACPMMCTISRNNFYFQTLEEMSNDYGDLIAMATQSYTRIPWMPVSYGLNATELLINLENMLSKLPEDLITDAKSVWHQSVEEVHNYFNDLSWQYLKEKITVNEYEDLINLLPGSLNELIETKKIYPETNIWESIHMSKKTNKENIEETLKLFHKYNNIDINKDEEHDIENFLKSLSECKLNIFIKFLNEFIETTKDFKIKIYVFDSGESTPTFQFLITPKNKNMNIEEKVDFLYKFISIKNNLDKNNFLWFVNFALDY